jgi:hypothetical protein
MTTKTTTTMTTTTTTTAATTEPDFSMLGFSSLAELDRLPEIRNPLGPDPPAREEEDLEQLYRQIQRQRVRVGAQDECFRLRALNGGRWTPDCPARGSREGRGLGPAPPPPALPPRPDCCEAELQPVLLR